MRIVPPNLIPRRLRKSEVKDEHPLQEEWDRIAEQAEEQKHPLLRRPPNPDLDVVYGHHKATATLRLMKLLEERIDQSPLNGYFVGGYPFSEDDRRKMAWLIEDDIVLFLIHVSGYNYEQMGKSSCSEPMPNARSTSGF